MNGFLLVNKPSGPTSHDIVDRVRRATGVKCVGHAGTLDPFATGLLIVGVGREATREFPKLVGLPKCYRATLHLGAVSDTDDRTGQIAAKKTWPANHEQFSPDQLNQVLKKFTGKILQVPPMYSAKKVKGKKLYELAREGVTIERQPVELEIYSIEIVGYVPSPALHLLTLDLRCSSGTYVRALARDIGETLGCGAYLEELERTAIGPFVLSEAEKMENLNSENWEKHLCGINETIERAAQSLGGKN